MKYYVWYRFPGEQKLYYHQFSKEAAAKACHDLYVEEGFEEVSMTEGSEVD